MYGKLQQHLQQELEQIHQAGLYKKERVITSPQGADIKLQDGKEVINFCANNYLGLSSHPRVIEAAKKSLDTHGFGMSSVRFICGTQDIHKQLEAKIAEFYGTEDTILYAAAFDANGGVFEPLFGENDAIISDSLNHASIIDGVRLCKAARFRYANNNMADLEQQLIAANAAGHTHKIIVTDGVFSMDGYVAQLDEITALANQYDALVMVDECHAAGFIGKTGKGTPELCGVHGEIDIITGTLGKALGGAMGGYTTGKKEIIDLLRQRSRPYLFSNSLAPAIVAASLEVFNIISESTALRDKLEWNVKYFKEGVRNAGFDFKDGESAIVPIMLYDAKLSQTMADKLLDEGIYVIGFFFPVVAKDQARIRVQLSAAHEQHHLDKAIAAFTKVGKELGVINSMFVSGFTIARNAVKADYPLKEAIYSILPLCDELIVAVGKSEDNTLAYVQSFNEPKIKILETIWDDSLREGGKVLAAETNKAMAAISPQADWCFYIQADECLNDKDVDALRFQMEQYKDDEHVEGLLFNYIHFYGNYNYIADSRSWYRHEVRIIKNLPSIYSYKDAQGFRINNRKLKVKKANASIFHYGWVKNPVLQLEKLKQARKLWHSDDFIAKEYDQMQAFDYDNVDSLVLFKGHHPGVMLPRIKAQNWKFNYDISKKKMTFKKHLLYLIEKLTGIRIGEYKNYKLI